MDYKKMTADELIHLISNQALNQDIKEQHKLVIQDCCKELFNKKHTIKKYKRIKYSHSKYFWDPVAESDNVRTRIKSRIVEIIPIDYSGDYCPKFPEQLSYKLFEKILEEKYVVFRNSPCHEGDSNTFTILEVEDI